MDVEYIDPFTRDILNHVCIVMSGYTENETSTLHFMTCELPASRVRGVSGSIIRHLMNQPSLLYISMSDPFNMIVRNATASNMSGMEILRQEKFGGHCVEVLLCVIVNNLWVVSHLEYVFFDGGCFRALHVLFCILKYLIDLVLHLDDQLPYC